MNRYLVLMVFSLCLISVSHAVWTYNPNFQNAYNVTVANWNYTAGSWGFKSYSGYALVTLYNTGSPQGINIVGYDRALNNIGQVQWWVINQNSSAITLLLRNKTNLGLLWNTATVFYNPFNPSTAINTYSGQNPWITQLQFRNNTVIIPKLVYAPLLQHLNNGSIIQSNQSFGLRYSTFISNSSSMHLNFTLNTTNTGSLVMLNQYKPSNTLKFNLNGTWAPTQNTQYQYFNKPNGRFELCSNGGIFNGCVTNTILTSSNANAVFLNNNNAFESWFSFTSNQIAISGMERFCGIISCGIANSTSTNSETVVFSPIPLTPLFNTTLLTNVPETTYIIPAFTTNYIVANVATNNAAINTTAFTSFNNWINITNINWTYSTNSFSVPLTSFEVGNNVKVSVGAGYLIVNVTHYLQMGSFCNNVDAFDVQNGNSLGSIPMFVLNCSPSSFNARFLLYNTTSLGFTYNSFGLYFNNPNLTLSPGFSNSIVLNNWQIATGSSFTITGFVSNSLPFVVRTPLGIPLNTGTVKLSTDAGNEIFGTHLSNLNQLFGNMGIGNVTDFTGFSINTILYAFNNVSRFNPVCYPSCAPNSLFSQVLAVTKNLSFSEKGLGGSESTFVANSFDRFTSGAISTSLAYNVIVTNVPLAQALRLWTMNYTNAGEFSRTGIVCQFNCTLPSAPTTPTNYGNTVKGLNYTATTTINFNSNTLLTQTIAPGVSLPKIDFLALALVLIVIGSGLFATHQLGHFSFVLMLIGLWISSLWQIDMLILAILVTVLFLIAEFLQARRISDHKIEHDS